MCVGCMYVLWSEAVCPDVREEPRALRMSLGCEGSLCPGENFGHGFSQWGTGRNLCAVGSLCAMGRDCVLG